MMPTSALLEPDPSHFGVAPALERWYILMLQECVHVVVREGYVAFTSQESGQQIRAVVDRPSQSGLMNQLHRYRIIK